MTVKTCSKCGGPDTEEWDTGIGSVCQGCWEDECSESWWGVYFESHSEVMLDFVSELT